jgi:hypothetical protein
MKKVLLIMLAIMLVASMAYAEERLSLSGQMRVWGLSMKGYDIDGGGAYGANPDESADYFTQRFRLAAKITASEGVYGHLRFDFAEDHWGSDNMGAARYDETSELQVDRAYLEVDKEKFNIKAGQLLTGLGNYIIVDMQGQGMNLTYKATPNLAITFDWLKRDENGARTDYEDAATTTDTEDLDVYALNVAFSKDDKFSGNFFFATSIDKTLAEDDTQNAIGLQGKAALGKINLNAELDFLFGENKNTNQDYVGTQLYIDANSNINDSTMAGLRLIYAMGNDDADKTQLSNLNRGAGFGDFLPFAFGIFDDGDWDGLLDGAGYFPMEIGGTNAGAMAIALYGEKRIKEKFALRGLAAYGAPAEDSVTALDSAILINAGAEYEFAQDTVVQGCVNYIMPSFDDNRDDDAALGLMAGLRLNF